VTALAVQAQLIIWANVVIALGYLAVPMLFLRYLPLTRRCLTFGAGFCLGSMGTHAGLALALSRFTGEATFSAWFWTVEHVVQAVCIWGFIICFHRMLRAASARRIERLTGAVTPRRPR
jgi:hypothetical protein